MLTSDEQEQIISQADKYLKSAKGRAMMPPLSRDDIYDMFKVYAGTYLCHLL